MSRFPIRARRPRDALDPGRMGYDLTADPLLLHTIQTKEAFAGLMDTGTLDPAPDRAEPVFAEAYDWMYRQMDARLHTSGAGAVWLWARTRRASLTDLCRFAPGEMLLTCRVPRERVLLSHFDEWHMVLNRHPVPPRIPGDSVDEAQKRVVAAAEDFDRRLRDVGITDRAPSRDWPVSMRDEIEQSWEYILSPSHYGPFEIWQATTHALFEDDIVQATEISP